MYDLGFMLGRGYYYYYYCHCHFDDYFHFLGPHYHHQILLVVRRVDNPKQISPSPPSSPASTSPGTARPPLKSLGSQ